MTKDTISDILTRIRNANLLKHKIVQIPVTKMAVCLLEILKEEGFIQKLEQLKKNNKYYFLVSLKYIGISKEPVICNLKRISKPGLRVYVNSKTLPIVVNNLGIAIISTSQGIMTNLRAKNRGIGGEVLCYIW